MAKKKNQDAQPTVGAQFEIEQRAITLLRSQLPPCWMIRPQAPDFHLDYLLEVSEGGELTGVQAGLQLKGTAPNTGFKKSPKYKLKGKHIRYFLEKCTFPVFLLLADVNNNVIYWLFLQEFAKTSLAPHQLNQKGITVTFELNRTLSNVLEFRSAIPAAEKFMRELRPGSIQAAVKSRKQELEAKDKRIKVEIDTIGGAEHVKLEAVEAFSLSTQFSPQNPATFVPAFKDFVEAGKPMEIEVSSLSITGSPLVEALLPDRDSTAKVAIAPAKRTSADVMLQIAGASPTVLAISGQVTSGTKYIRFEGSLPDAPLVITLSLPIDPFESKTATVSFDFVPSRWLGQQVRSLAFFEKTRCLFQALNDNQPILLELSRAGNRIVGADVRDLKSRAVEESLGIINFLEKLRLIFRHFGIESELPRFENISDQECADVEELSMLVRNKQFVLPAPDCELSLTLRNNALPKESPIAVAIEFRVKEYLLLGQKIVLGPIRQEITSLRITSATQTQNGTSFSLKGDAHSFQKLLWLRFENARTA